MREALFSILGERSRGARVLDLYAGTGALGLEALSRGAKSAVFVDYGEAALGLIRKNIELCGFADRSLVVRRDLARGAAFLRELCPAGGFDLIFLDPPYRQGLVDSFMWSLAGLALLAEEGVVVAEEGAEVEPVEVYPGFILEDRRRYGDTTIWFYNHCRKDVA